MESFMAPEEWLIRFTDQEQPRYQESARACNDPTGVLQRQLNGPGGLRVISRAEPGSRFPTCLLVGRTESPHSLRSLPSDAAQAAE